MKCNLLFLATISLLLLAATLSTNTDLSWNAISGGGGTTTNGIYTLDSVVTQPVAGLSSVSTSELCSGFLCLANEGKPLYLPLMVR